MGMTAAALIARRDLGLRLICAGAPGALEESVTWAHQSELADPTQFSEPNEVLLTTGLSLPREGMTPPQEVRSACERYVRRLAGSRTVALGFGVGVHHPTTPAALIEAAERHRLPLFEIPVDLPFSAISKAVSRALAEEENERLRRTHAAQRRLIAAAGTADVVRAVVMRTAELIGGWAAFVDPAGSIIELSHLAARPTVHAAVARHRRSGRPSTFHTEAGTELSVYDAISPQGSPLGLLITGTRNTFDSLTSAVPLLATSLLSMAVSRAEAGDTAMRHLRSVIMGELLEGNVSLARAVSRDLWSGLPLEPCVVVCVIGPSDELDALHAELVPVRRDSRAPHASVAFGEDGGRLWLIAPAPQAEDLCARMSQDRPVTCGASEPTTWEHIRRARHEAASSALVAHARQTSLGRPGGRARSRTGNAAGVSVVDALDPVAARAFARVVLGGLIEESATARELLRTVTTWLEADGGIDQTAIALGVHRHTVRRRLRRAEEILGVRLQESRVRHELWFACSWWRAHGEPASDPAGEAGRDGTPPA